MTRFGLGLYIIVRHWPAIRYGIHRGVFRHRMSVFNALATDALLRIKVRASYEVLSLEERA